MVSTDIVGISQPRILSPGKKKSSMLRDFVRISQPRILYSGNLKISDQENFNILEINIILRKIDRGAITKSLGVDGFFFPRNEVMIGCEIITMSL